MKKRNFLFVFCMIALMLFAVSVSANAAEKGYSIREGNTRVYSNTSFTKNLGWIYDSDEVTILSINSGYLKVRYYTTKPRTKTGYVKPETMLLSTNGWKSYTARAKITTYKRPNGSSYGYIALGDKVYVLGTYGGDYVQVKYPVGSGYKYAFIRMGDYQNSIAPASHNPQGSFDSVENNGDGTISVSGWAFDRDDLNVQLDIHVYVGGDLYVLKADKYRPDVEQVFNGTGQYHGFANKLLVEKTGVQKVDVYAINVGGGDNVLLGSKSITIPPQNQSGDTSIANGWYMVISGNSEDRVLDINGWNGDNGGNLETYNKNNTTNQRIGVEYQGDGYYALKVLHSGKYIHVADGGNPYCNVHQWEGCTHHNSHWAFINAGDGYFYLKNRGNGSFLDNAGGSTQLGNNVGSYPANYSDAQKWKFVSTSDGSDEVKCLEEGWYTVQSANDNRFVWDINAGTNNGMDDGANLEVYESHGGNNQKFFLKDSGRGYYYIMAGHSGKYLHKQDAGHTNNVLQWAGYSENAIQTQWVISPAGNGYYYVRSMAGNYVDNCNQRAVNGNNVITYYFNGTDAQRWKFVPTSEPSSPQDNQPTLVSTEEINNAASRYGISTSSNTFAALNLINSKYESSLSGNKNGFNVFLFEGVGNSAVPNERKNAMCVVVKNGEIIFLNRNCCTIPDYPFTPSKNGGTPMPTLKDGIYGFTTVNHRGRYAALNVSNAKVVRFRSKNSYYNGTSSAINVHQRSTNSIAGANKTWVNSAGCQLIGLKSEYIDFIRALGIVSGNTVTTYSRRVSGYIVIDRSFAEDYLRDVGYPSSAIAMIRG